ncbi:MULTISPECIES: amino acid ABC transporter permease [unclassified Aureimonas]|uniref:amino acid ABC transporter permease n=1 Tax=unclassified Aureimonas TaxID=2615206 RepID=UPI0006F98279|nr:MULTISPECIES: amino acid ABC transporter permease [unclassified Aureimonas]KQT63977.1 polar amino acid ABC transporter permease [Aureimonas sp. Leaf427]KQT81170.1 polar amino acid ABC transporter permease [Aureimonas sp. Leaf460]
MIFQGIDVVWDHRDELAAGFTNTLAFAMLGFAGALALGILLAIVLMSRFRVAARIVLLFVALMRCSPFLLLVYLVYYALPLYGLRLDNWTAGLLTLVVYNAAYVAEALKGGWLGVPKDQIEAGEAFGLFGLQLTRRVVLPAVFLSTVPTLGNQAIQVVKDSSFLAIIAVPELTAVSNSIQSNYYVPFAAFLSAIVLYWIICLGVETFVAIYDRRTRRYRG